MTVSRLSTLGRILLAIGMLLAAPIAATAAPDISGTVIINEDNGFPGFCDAPCFSVQKLSEVYFAGNNTGPIACGAGQNLFVYTLTHLGGSIDPAPPVQEFELAADDALVASAGFIPGTGVAPSTTTVSPLDVVSWEFMAPPIFQTQSSEKLYICATGAVGAPGTTLVSISAGPLDAPGQCIGPVPGGACDIDIDKTCCIPSDELPGDDDGDSDTEHGDSDSASDRDANGDSDGSSDSSVDSDSDSDSDKGNLCDSKVVSLVVEVTGGACADTTNSQQGKASCSGPDPVLSPAIDMVTITAAGWGASSLRINGVPGPVTVPAGSNVTFTHTSGQLAYSTQFKVAGPGGTQKLGIVTSCDKGLHCGDQFGSVELVAIETTQSGLRSCTLDPNNTRCVAPSGPEGSHPGDNDGDSDTPLATDSDSASDNDANGDSDGHSDSTVDSDSDSDSDKCGKISEAVFKFTASACQSPLPNPQGGDAECYGNASDATLPVSITYTGKSKNNTTVTPASGIQNGSTFRVTATGMAALKDNLKLSISDFNSVEQSLELNVGGCEQLACGDEFGSLKLVGYTKVSGEKVDCTVAPPPPYKQACECPIGPPKPHCTGSLEGMRLVYLKELFGANCSVTNNQAGLASCSGANLVDDNVSITILTDPSNISATPSSGIDAKDTFTITKVVSGDLKQLPPQVQFLAMDGSGNTQTVTIQTDCSKALDLGDRYGDFAVGCLDRGDGNNDNGGADSDSDSDSDSDPAAAKDGEDGLVCVGCEIEYQYKITNPNATGLVNVEVMDDRFSPPPIAAGVTLAPGESKFFFLTQTLFDTTKNTATVTGELATGGECTVATDDVTTTVTLPPTGSFDCTKAKPIDEINMTWNGTQTVSVKAWKGSVGSLLLLTDTDVAPGEVVTVKGISNFTSPVWEIFEAGDTVIKIGESKFDLSCYDGEMNGIEDCGKNEGNGKYNTSGLINTWLFEGMAGDQRLECNPGVVDSGTGDACGLGVELALLLPGLLWLRGRRRRAS